MTDALASELAADVVVERFLTESSGTMDYHIAAALRWVHPDAYFGTGGFDPPRIKDRDDLVGDLEKAKGKLSGFKYEIITSAGNGDRVLTRDVRSSRAGRPHPLRELTRR